MDMVAGFTSDTSYLIVLVLIALAGGALLNASSLIAKIIGGVLVIGVVFTAAKMLPVAVPSAIISFALTLLFIAVSVRVFQGRAGAQDGHALIGGLMVIVGVVAAWIQFQGFVALPTGTISEVWSAGWHEAVSVINQGASGIVR